MTLRFLEWIRLDKPHILDFCKPKNFWAFWSVTDLGRGGICPVLKKYCTGTIISPIRIQTAKVLKLEVNSRFMGGFQLEFVSRVINHMTCYRFECSHWLKLQHSDWRANLVKNFFEINFPPMSGLKSITGHVIYNPAYTYKFQLNTTYVMSRDSRWIHRSPTNL